ncbi:MAG: hypothetical protein KDA87_05090 [Planctomycetales bacterium]|nr:hypothetical protein [Planctomycetales bacterium]
MQSSVTVWEDDETNRRVHFEVCYKVDAAGIEVSKVTPTHVEFPHQGRTVGVWTNSGRKVLLTQARNSGHFDNMISQFEQEHFTQA